MDDSGAQGVVSRGDILTMAEERIDKGARPVAGGGVDDHSGRFVNGEHVFVFVEDIEGDIFRGNGGLGRCLKANFDLIAFLGKGPFFRQFPIEEDGPDIDQVLEVGAGVDGEARG